MKLNKNVIIFLSIFYSFISNAQTLPKVQQASVRAPFNVKIDGKADEWDNKFQAFHPPSRAFYTLSNDNDNLYLIVRMDDFLGSEKTVKAGITFTVNEKKDIKTKGKKNVTITFPIWSENSEAIADILWLTKLEKNERKTDSLRSVLNKKINTAFKLLQVSGIDEITESLISIYNSQQIQIATQFDRQMKLVIELALPLKYLKDAIDGNGRIVYKMKFNSNNRGGLMISNAANVPPDVFYQLYPTDFSGEYALAK